MVDALLLVFREIIEAATIISLLLALCYKFRLKYYWVWAAIGAGFSGSWLMAYNAYAIAEMIDGAGQEIIDSVLYSIVIISVMLIIFLITSKSIKNNHSTDNTKSYPLLEPSEHWKLYVLLALTVSCSAAREGYEIIIYLFSFAHQANAFYTVITGAVIGAGIGISLGAIGYYSFSFMPQRFFLSLFLMMITLIIGGLAMQIAKELMQIGWLESTPQLWDSSFLIDEQSWLGGLLYALIGYDSKPNITQGIFYLVATGPVAIGILWYYLHSRVKKHA